jgi:ParB family chromosome partitioning protein
VERIHPKPDQPRRKIDETALKGLVDSIREQGVIQPLIVRRRDRKSGFELIAGERRWRAAQLAGLKEIPVCIKEATSDEAFEMALVENIQREDLNPIEEAQAYKRLVEEHGHTQAEVASRVGRDRSTVANSLRLLRLPPKVLAMVAGEQLTEGHARALLQASESRMLPLARAVVSRGLSVRETERRARSESSRTKRKKRDTASQSAETKALALRLQRKLGSKVKIVDRKGKGRIEINYLSYDELDGILNKILK